jgi:hypothetical protein
MPTLKDGDFDSMADYLLGRANKGKHISPPIDLFELAKIQHVTAVDLRPMVPTGGLSLRSSGFVIYIQDLGRSQPVEVPIGIPVEDRPKMTTRQRFTMAHELAHTLVFGASDPPQPRPDPPKGAKLEALCHRAARRILMPERVMATEVEKRGKLGSRDLLDLARDFECSKQRALRSRTVGGATGSWWSMIPTAISSFSTIRTKLRPARLLAMKRNRLGRPRIRRTSDS